MFSKQDYKKRLENAQSQLKPSEALLVSKDENVRYFTGVDSGKLLIWRDGFKYWLNDVYFGRAKNSYAEPESYEKDCISNFIFRKGFKKVGMDEISLEGYNNLKPKLRKLVIPSNIPEDLRKIKDKKEIKCLDKAGSIASNAFDSISDMHIIGMTEFELAAQIEYEIRKNESEKPPFSEGMLCLSGPNTRYPHAPSTERKIGGGDLVILDFGAVYKGYFSDMTRTLKIGEVSKEKQDLVESMVSLKESAIDRVELGGKIADIHNYIEKAIEKMGYKFAHLSGHGVGLEIHEAPSVGPSEEDVFREGMVFTIEPGVYTTKFGARSEETITLIDGKKKILTK